MDGGGPTTVSDRPRPGRVVVSLGRRRSPRVAAPARPQVPPPPRQGPPRTASTRRVVGPIEAVTDEGRPGPEPQGRSVVVVVVVTTQTADVESPGTPPRGPPPSDPAVVSAEEVVEDRVAPVADVTAVGTGVRRRGEVGAERPSRTGTPGGTGPTKGPPTFETQGPRSVWTVRTRLDPRHGTPSPTSPG